MMGHRITCILMAMGIICGSNAYAWERWEQQQGRGGVQMYRDPFSEGPLEQMDRQGRTLPDGSYVPPVGYPPQHHGYDAWVGQQRPHCEEDAYYPPSYGSYPQSSHAYGRHSRHAHSGHQGGYARGMGQQQPTMGVMIPPIGAGIPPMRPRGSYYDERAQMPLGGANMRIDFP